jgi:hypothetical protein
METINLHFLHLTLFLQFHCYHNWHSRMESKLHIGLTQYRRHALEHLPDSMPLSATFWGQIGLLLCQVALHFSVLNTMWLHECWIFYCISSVIKNFCLLWAVLVLLVSSSTNDTSAYINLARVFAQRCLESGISEVRCDLKPLPGGKVSWKWLQNILCSVWLIWYLLHQVCSVYTSNELYY